MGIDRMMDFVVGLIVALMVAAILLLLIAIPVNFRASAKCLANGYPVSETTWDLKSYCISANWATVVPISEIGK